MLSPLYSSSDRRSLSTLALSCLLLLAVPVAAQDGGEATGEEENGQPSSPFDFKDGDTSQNNEILENILERFPDSDTNKDGVLDAEEGRAFMEKQRERWRDRREPPQRRRRLVATHRDIAYGPEAKHHLDLYLAESDEPTPLVVFFHGGQFITGEESDHGTLDIRGLLDAGISVASVDYRTAGQMPFPGPFDDAARAVQFLRLQAENYNLDPDRFAGHGEEAGGNLALYLALHDDLAKPLPRPNSSVSLEEDEDPEFPEEEREPWDDPLLETMSTRLTCAVARHPIASFDPRSWKKHKLPMNGHERLMRRYLDVNYIEPLDDDEVIALVEQVSPLALVSADDPELLLMSQYPDDDLAENTVWTIMAHHPRQSQLIAEAMRAKGNKATVRYRGMRNDPGTTSVEFFIQKLKG